uniref:Delta-like protein n=1 Tax=Periophthalmus magnuspinnatus TaxID=409849 RepID=A0A3B4AJB5_9GOBI
LQVFIRSHSGLVPLVYLVCVWSIVLAVGMFELQIRNFQNLHGLLHNGRCSARDQCDTYFQACLKEYQARVFPTGPCTFGTGTTGVLGGNSHSLYHPSHGAEDNTNGHIVIPFKYAWPVSTGAEWRVLLSSMLNPGEQWQVYRHHGRTLSLEYRLRFRCDSNYYGPFCSKFCRARDDFFGHFKCDPNGSKVCIDGWTGPECKEGCNQLHGFCNEPGECKCHYGWMGALCDKCLTFPGCMYGSCTEPWQCVCDINWGGLLCDKGRICCYMHQSVEKFPHIISAWELLTSHFCHSLRAAHGTTHCTTETTGWHSQGYTGLHGVHIKYITLYITDLNYCGTHQPCKNGGTCTNTEPNEYQCECQNGFKGRNCENVEHACLSSPCLNGATCEENPSGFSCICTDGWTGLTCAQAVRQCDRRPCGQGSTCEEDLVSGSRCQCPLGFFGKYCQQGQNPCASFPCQNGGQCVAKDGRNTTCTCPFGYEGTYCEVNMDAFSSEWAEMLYYHSHLFQFCAYKYLTKSHDPCNPNPCKQGAACHSSEGRYLCACPEGYYGNECMTLKNPCIGLHCPGKKHHSTFKCGY